MKQMTIDVLEGENWLSYKGPVEFTNYYKMLWEWLKNNGFGHRPSSTDDSDNSIEIEDYQSEIRMPNFSNQWIWWRVAKYKPNGSDLFHFEMDINFQTLGLGKKEVMHNGQKMNLHNGEINVKIRARVIFHADKITDNWISEMMFNQLRWRYYQKLIEEHKADLYDMAMEFYDRAKTYVGLPAVVTTFGTSFHPKFGYPQVQEQQK